MSARYTGGYAPGARIVQMGAYGRAARLRDQMSPALIDLTLAARRAGLRGVQWDAGRLYADDPRTGEPREITCQVDLDVLAARRDAQEDAVS